jgi:hypothetical protein
MRTDKTRAFEPTAQEQDRNKAAHKDNLQNNKPKTKLMDRTQAGPGVTD